MKSRPAILVLLLWVAAAFPCRAASPWRSLGPDQMGSGQVNVLTFDPHRPSRAFAGLRGGGIARSGDGGRTWRTMSEGLTGSQVSSIVVHPALGRLVYAVADGFLHCSSNDGRTWVRLPFGRVRVIAPDSRDPAVVWAGTSSGLFRSRDSGDTWERIQANLPAYYVVSALAVDRQNPLRIYLGINGINRASDFGFWVSEDGGQTWARRSRTEPDSLYADLHHAGTVYFLRSGNVFRSRDAGRTLQSFFFPLPSDAGARLLTADPQDASTFFLTVENRTGDSPALLRTADGGRTWRSFAAGLPARPLDPTALAVSSDGHVLLGIRIESTHFEVVRSEASAPDWEPASRGLINSGGYSIAVGRSGALFINEFSVGVVRSLDGGATWRVSNPIEDLTGPLAVAPSDPDTLYAGNTFPHLLSKTTDGGETWVSLPYVLPAGGPGLVLAASDVAVDPADRRTVFLSTIVSGNTPFELAGLFRSRDGGQTWQKIGQSIEGLGLQAVDLQTFPGEPGKLLAIHGYAEVYLSTDYGETWEKVLDRTETFYFLYRLAVAPSNPQVVYAAQEDGTLFRSDDGGATFVSLGNRLRAGLLTSIAVDPKDPDTILFPGTEGVVRLTLGRGRELLPAFFARQIQNLLFDPNDPLRLLAGTESAGLMEYRFEAAATP